MIALKLLFGIRRTDLFAFIRVTSLCRDVTGKLRFGTTTDPRNPVVERRAAIAPAASRFGSTRMARWAGTTVATNAIGARITGTDNEGEPNQWGDLEQ